MEAGGSQAPPTDEVREEGNNLLTPGSHTVFLSCSTFWFLLLLRRGGGTTGVVPSLLLQGEPEGRPRPHLHWLSCRDGDGDGVAGTPISHH